jgi:hypothetical protein
MPIWLAQVQLVISRLLFTSDNFMVQLPFFDTMGEK